MVDAKSFSLSATTNKSKIRLEEKRKIFHGSISLGIRRSYWLADMVEEVMLYQGKEDFVRSFREELEALMVRKGCNKASCFLEVAVFAQGG